MLQAREVHSLESLARLAIWLQTILLVYPHHLLCNSIFKYMVFYTEQS